MDTPKKLLVCLDMTEWDAKLLKFAAYLSNVLPLKDIIIIHNILLEEPPKELQDLYPEAKQPVEKLVKKEIRENIADYLTDSSAELKIKIFQNETASDIVKWANHQQVDMSLLGSKPAIEGQGIFSSQFLRLSSHPVLLLPAEPPLAVKKILAPIDFSKNAVSIIRSAQQLSGYMEANVNYLHLYSLPPQYFPYLSRNMDKYREEYLNYGQKIFKKLKNKALGDEEAGICQFKLIDKGGIAKEIYQYAQQQNADLLIAGAKGKTDAEVLFLGSITEKLMTTVKQIPLLVVKTKAQYSWLESLLN